MITKHADPKHVDISLSQGIKILWADGHESQFPLEYLRKNCPCATCRSASHTATEPKAAASAFQMFQPTAKLTNAKSVGRYAVQLFWADGHSTGMYSFDHFREICPCPECRSAAQHE